MQRREFLGRFVGAVSASLMFGHQGRAEDVPCAQMGARRYLRLIMPDHQRVADFISGECGPRDQQPGEVFRYDPQLGWVNHRAVGSDGVDGSKVFYDYECDGARKVINFADCCCRVHTYGDSFTHCSQVNNNETWQEYLAAHLQEPIRNYGVGGYSVYQAYRRMLRVEASNPAEFIIFNIWDDDHYRNLDAWRSIRFGCGSRCGFTLPHLRVDLQRDMCEQIENLLPKAEDLYRLCDEDFVWETFKDDPVLCLVMAAEAYGVRRPLVDPVAVSFGVPDASIADTELAWRARDIHTQAALFASKRVIGWIEEFVRATGKKIMVVLSFGRGNVAAYLDGKIRFDKSFVDWLKAKPYPVIDMCDVFAADFRKYRVDVNTYLQPFYNGHHTPGGNFFTAWAIKDAVVKWLAPAPMPYR